MKNIVIVFALITIIGFIVRYIYNSKKSGKKCIGCPYNETCCTKDDSSCGCEYK